MGTVAEASSEWGRGRAHAEAVLAEAEVRKLRRLAAFETAAVTAGALSSGRADWPFASTGAGAGLFMAAHEDLGYRVVSEQALFAMPEVAIGLCPDVGSTHFLQQSFPGRAGLWCALTGARLDQRAMLASGLATHACSAAQLPATRQATSTGLKDWREFRLCVHLMGWEPSISPDACCSE